MCQFAFLGRVHPALQLVLCTRSCSRGCCCKRPATAVAAAGTVQAASQLQLGWGVAPMAFWRHRSRWMLCGIAQIGCSCSAGLTHAKLVCPACPTIHVLVCLHLPVPRACWHACSATVLLQGRCRRCWLVLHLWQDCMFMGCQQQHSMPCCMWAAPQYTAAQKAGWHLRANVAAFMQRMPVLVRGMSQAGGDITAAVVVQDALPCLHVGFGVW